MNKNSENRYLSDSDKWETNAEIFEDLQKRLSATITELKSIRSDIGEYTDAMMNKEGDTAADTYEIKDTREVILNAINSLDHATMSLDYFEETYQEDWFYEGGF